LPGMDTLYWKGRIVQNDILPKTIWERAIIRLCSRLNYVCSYYPLLIEDVFIILEGKTILVDD
jgi:hypothetical protein